MASLLVWDIFGLVGVIVLILGYFKDKTFFTTKDVALLLVVSLFGLITLFVGIISLLPFIADKQWFKKFMYLFTFKTKQ